MKQRWFDTLISKLLTGNASEKEKQLLEEYLTRMAEKQPDPLPEDQLQDMEARSLELVMQQIHGVKPPVKRSGNRQLFLKTAVAASIALVITAGLIWWFRPQDGKDGVPVSEQQDQVGDNIVPGGFHAELILSNGHIIKLDSTRNGEVTFQGNNKISKPQNGRLVYERVHNRVPDTGFNSVATRRGGLYQVILPDGSQVWLNSASLLRFPTSFSGKSRRVELSGEACFQVAKNASMPFHVIIGQTDVEVTGTFFNVMSYADEGSLKLTLVDGHVILKDKRLGKAVNIKPGQQGQVNATGNITLVRNIDTTLAVAWKNGNFSFKEDSIETVMRQVERWYNVQVVYEGKITHHFNGPISRNTPIAKLLQVLEMTKNVRFRIEGRKIVVSPY